MLSERGGDHEAGYSHDVFSLGAGSYLYSNIMAVLLAGANVWSLVTQPRRFLQWSDVDNVELCRAPLNLDRSCRLWAELSLMRRRLYNNTYAQRQHQLLIGAQRTLPDTAPLFHAFNFGHSHPCYSSVDVQPLSRLECRVSQSLDLTQVISRTCTHINTVGVQREPQGNTRPTTGRKYTGRMRVKTKQSDIQRKKE